MPSKKQKNTTTENVIEHVAPEIEVIPAGKFTKMESFLWQIREICRARGFQIWGNQQLVNQIYQDLLFIYHIPRLMAQGILTLDVNAIGDGKLTNVSFTSLLTLKEPEHILAALRVLWSELQNSEVKDLFAGRSFILFDIAKKENKKKKCLDLMMDIFRYASKINLENYDSNSGYTYFKKELNKAIAKTFGQFYTPPTVTYSVVKMVDPKIGETVLDPSCGSCSFLAEAANYMVKREKVDMATAFTNLYGVELESNIYAEGVMNMFINFGIMPNMKENIIEKDALIHLLSDPTTYSKIIANPPFGADAKDFKEWYFKTIMVPTKAGSSKMKKKIVENPEAHFKLPFPKTNESAILFFQLIVLKLKEAGKAGVVMSATILNDGFKDMMEWFLNCCSLEKIVINPAGTFKEQGTGIETFSFIFTKGKPTTTVKIVMLGAEDDAVRTLTIDQIKEAGWKLQLKEEEKKVENQAFCYDEIKNLFVYEHGTIAASTAIPGDFPFMTLDDTATHSSFAYDGENLFISKIPSGTGSTFTPKFRYSNGKVHASSLMLRLIPKSERVSLKFFYYFWKLKPIDFLRSFYKGAANKSLDQDLFGSFRFPIPPLHIQQEIVTALDLIYNNAATAKAAATSVKSQMAAVVRSVGARGFERKKLGDVCEFNTNISKHDTHYGKETGLRPFYTGAANNKLFTDTPDIHHPVIIMNRTNGAGKCNLFIDTECAVAGQAMVFYMKDKDEKTLQYLYHYLNTFKTRVEEGYVGSNHKNISNGFMETFEVEFPPLPVQHEVLAILNEIEAELQTLEQMAAKAEQRAKFILDGYLTPAPQAVEAEPVVDPNSIAAFIEKHIVHEDGAEASFKDIIRKYKEWCITRPEHVLLKKSELMAALSLVLGDLENEKYKGVKLI